MYKDFIKQQSYAELYAIVSLCIFVVFFCIMIVAAFMQSKLVNKEASMIPLDNDKDINTKIQASNV